MRGLEIITYANEPCRLPIAYNALIQGALYSCWKDDFSSLHDAGFAQDEGAFRLFTFSPLRGKCRVKDKTITFTGAVSFEVRSPQEDLLDVLAQTLAERGEVRLGRQTLPIVNLKSADRLIFPQQAVIEMVAPITLHRTLPDGHTHYIAPSDDEFADALRLNIERKVAAYGAPVDTDMDIMPIYDTLKKRVTTFKGTYITGWTGRFVLKADPQLMALLHCTGLGARNSQGFGMFDIIDRPLG